jgi:DNA-binding GntR family transcriptional regulator
MVSAMDFQSKSDVVTAALREAIFTGEIEAGAPLRQRDIAVRFGVSPTPVREALRRLESEGLLDYDLHRGATVVQGDFGPSEENYQIRAALESLAARLAAERISGEALDELHELHEAIARCRAKDPAVTELNRRFHFKIYEAAGSAMLLALLRLLWQSFRQGPQVIRPLKQSVSEHEALLEALRRADAHAAERITRDHILGAAAYLPKSAAARNPGARAAVVRRASA